MINQAMFRRDVKGYSTIAGCTTYMPREYFSFSFDIIAFLVVIILWYIIGFQSPVYTMQLVYEKEHKMRQIMRMSGLSDSTYWFVNFCTHFAMYAVLVFVTVVVMAGILNLPIFYKI